MSSPCTPEEVMRIRQLYAQGWTQGRLAREFQRNVGTIGRIVRGETHQELPQISPDITSSAAEAQKRFEELMLEKTEERQAEVASRFSEDLSKATALNEGLEGLKK